MYTYIIVDDETLTRKGTIKKIGTLDNRIECAGEAENGEAGLVLIQESEPDIIITDMNMPVVDGSQFLKAVCEKYPHKQIIVISGYKDFDYAKQAIQAKALSYILKPFSKEDIKEALLEAIRILENKKTTDRHIVSIEAEKEYVQYDYDIQMLKNLILGYHSGTYELNSVKLKTMYKLHHIVLMTIHSTKSLNEIALKEYSAASGYGDLGLYIPHLHNDKIGFFVLFFPENTPLKLYSTCRQICAGLIHLLSETDSYVTIGISGIKNDLLQLNTAFAECVDALNSKRISALEHYYFYTEIKEQHPRIHWEQAEEFLFRIEAAETHRVTELLNNLFLYFSNLPDLTLYEAKYYCNELIQNTKLMLNSYYRNNSGSNSSSIQNIFNSIFTFEELEEYLQTLFYNIASSITDSTVYTVEDTIEKIKIYIDRNYKNNLSLEFIASLFYINRSYLSSLFKDRTGQKFVDYINGVRINKAKYLLNQTDTKIYQISRSVGYDNQKYFFRIFKKVTGMTPEEYRRNEGTGTVS